MLSLFNSLSTIQYETGRHLPSHEIQFQELPFQLSEIQRSERERDTNTHIQDEHTRIHIHTLTLTHTHTHTSPISMYITFIHFIMFGSAY